MARRDRFALRSLATFLLLALAVLGLWTWLDRTSAQEELTATGGLAAPSETPSSAPPEPLAGGSPRAERAESPATKSDTEIAITGRFRDETGAAASDVELVLRRWHRAADDQRFEALPEIEVRGDARGVLALRVPHQPHLRLHLSLRDARYAAESWRWQDLASGAREELGEVVLVRGAVVRGRVLDRAGTPIATGWTIDAQRTKPETVQVVSLGTEAAATNGEFELRGFSAGTWRIEARVPTYLIASTEIELQAGETREVVLQQTSARDARRELVLHTSRPHQLFPGPAREHVKLLLPGGELRFPDPPRTTDRDGGIVFSSLAPGAYRLTIDDPRYEPWSADVEVPRAQPVWAKLRGTSSIDLSVVDGSSGRPVERFAFELLEHADSSANAHSSRMSGIPKESYPREDRPGGRLLIEDLVAGRLRFALQAEGLASRIVEIADLAPQERRAHRVELFTGVVLEGKVRRDDGRPVEGALVVAFAPAAKDDHPGAWLLPRNSMSSNEAECRREISRASSTSDGSFRLERLPPGTCIVTATEVSAAKPKVRPMEEGTLSAKVEGVQIPITGAPGFLEIVVPTGAVIHGRLLLPEGAPTELFAIVLSKISPAARDGRIGMARVDQRWIGGEERYRFEGLAPGEYEIAFALPSTNAEANANRKQLEHALCPSSLMRLQLLSGTTVERDLDLRPHAPAELRARISIAGPRSALTLQLAAADHETSTTPFGLSRQAARCTEDGTAHHRWIHPGRKAVVLSGGDGAWIHTIAQDLSFAPGEQKGLEVEVTLREGVLRVVDAAGTPLRDSRLQLVPVPDPRLALLFSNYGAEVSSDADARIRVALPAGNYVLRTPPTSAGGNPQHGEFSWVGGGEVQVALEAQR